MNELEREVLELEALELPRRELEELIRERRRARARLAEPELAQARDLRDLAELAERLASEARARGWLTRAERYAAIAQLARSARELAEL